MRGPTTDDDEWPRRRLRPVRRTGLRWSSPGAAGAVGRGASARRRGSSRHSLAFGSSPLVGIRASPIEGGGERLVLLDGEVVDEQRVGRDEDRRCVQLILGEITRKQAHAVGPPPRLEIRSLTLEPVAVVGGSEEGPSSTSGHATARLGAPRPKGVDCAQNCARRALGPGRDGSDQAFAGRGTTRSGDARS